ncbi:MAG TPA: DUF1444 family protein [Tepidisphaeraceae bacterium]|nr:DUF1444 family protein [Tepidisphaeraceae bacterium]
MSVPTREQFVDQVVKHVHHKFPLVKITKGDAPFSMRVNGHVASLENIYRIAILQPDESLHHIDRWVVELLRAGEGTPDQGGGFEALKDRILPMILPAAATPATGQTVHQPLVEGLSVAYAIDSDRTIAYIPKPQFDDWDVTLDDLHETALKNLVAKSEQLEAHAAQGEDGNVNLILFQRLDGYDASRILLPTLHDKLRGYLGSPFAAGIPNRDILLCFRNDDDTVARLRTQIADDYRSMPHQVTDKLLLVTRDGIAPRD